MYYTRRRGHFTRTEHVGKVLCCLNGEVTGNFRTSAGNFGAYHRCAAYITVENDCDSLVDVGLCELCPTACTVGVHRHCNARTTILVERVGSINNNIALNGSTTVALCNLYCVKLVYLVACLAVNSLNTPIETEVTGSHALEFGRREVFVDCCSVAVMSVTDNATCCVALNELQARKNGVLFLDSLNIGSLALSCCLGADSSLDVGILGSFSLG